jgi:hypothetical protein
MLLFPSKMGPSVALTLLMVKSHSRKNWSIRCCAIGKLAEVRASTYGPEARKGDIQQLMGIFRNERRMADVSPFARQCNGSYLTRSLQSKPKIASGVIHDCACHILHVSRRFDVQYLRGFLLVSKLQLHYRRLTSSKTS